MIYYTSIRLIDGKPRKVIVDETGKIVNRTPSKEEVKGLEEEPRKAHDTRKKSTEYCERCRENGVETKLICGKALREKDKEENWTGRWVCINCLYMTYYKYRSDSHNNIKKSLRDCRTGNQDPNSTNAKGDLFQELTCIWRSTVSTIPVEDLNKKLDNHRTPIDHTIDSELGIIQTKGCLYNSYHKLWHQNFEHENSQIAKGFEFDNLILYCVSKDGILIERLYIFPIIEIKNKRSSISITKTSTDRWGNSITPWYEEYRIKDEEVIKKVNEIWKTIK